MMFDKRKIVIAIGSIAFLLTACTDYYQQFEEEYAFGKTSGRFVFDGQTLTDLRNDQTYEVVKVGNLYWMNRNLGFQFYPSYFDESRTSCPNQSEETCEKTGFLYPGTRLDNLCIDGWRLPSTEEWEEYYNSSAYQGSTYGKDTYKGYESGDGSLNENGKSAYFWTKDYTDGNTYRKCVSVTPESNSFSSYGICHEDWKLAVRCVLDVDKANVAPNNDDDSGSEQNEIEVKNECSVKDGVKVVYPEGGETFTVGDTITVVYGSDVQGSGYRFVFKYSEDDPGVDLLDESAGPENPDGKTCYEQKVVLSVDEVNENRTTVPGIIRVVPYEHSKKGANSGEFAVEPQYSVRENEKESSSSNASSSSYSPSSSSVHTTNTSSSNTSSSSSVNTTNTSSSNTLSPSSLIQCGDLWCGTKDTEGRVETGSTDGTAGYWYDCNDAGKNRYGDNCPKLYDPNHDRGSSVFEFPADVEVNAYNNFFGPLIEAYGGVKGKVILGEGYQYPYAYLAFNLVSERLEGMDISAWGGLSLVYESTIGFSIELVPENESDVTEYNNYKIVVPKSSRTSTLDYPWAKFKQEANWGKEADRDTVLSKVATIRIKFEGTAGTTGDFNIRSIGRYLSCN